MENNLHNLQATKSHSRCGKFMQPKYFHALLIFVFFYVFANLISSIDFMGNAPDGTVIDLSDAHREELIELYRREQRLNRLERVGDKVQVQVEKYEAKYTIADKWVDEKDGRKKNTPGVSSSHIKSNNKLPEEGATNDLDPDLVDIFYAKNDGKDNSETPTKDSVDDENRAESETLKDPNLNQRGLDYNYDDKGNIMVNAAALMDYEDKLSNNTKILPKERIKYKPWEGAFYTEPYLMSKDVGKIDFECMDLRVVPSTPICLYQSEEDVYVSAFLRYNGVWEGHIVDQVQRALRKDEELGLIDLGANLGQYSLVAAKMGRKVFAVEPYSQTLKRFKKAAQMGNLTSNIRVLKNAVADVRDKMYIHLNPDNQGDARVDKNNKTCKTNCETVNSILLSDIVPYLNFDKAILKIDIQGYENVIFYYADHLFNHIHIPYIFMEWVLLREFYVHKDYVSDAKRDVEFTITYLTAKGYLAYSSINGKKLNLDYWGGWPEDVFWVRDSSEKDIFDAKAVLPKYFILKPSQT